jgi:hypothetical protein
VPEIMLDFAGRREEQSASHARFVYFEWRIILGRRSWQELNTIWDGVRMNSLSSTTYLV